MEGYISEAWMEVKRFLYKHPVSAAHEDHVRVALIVLCVLSTAMGYALKALGFRPDGEEEGVTCVQSRIQ